MSWPTTNEVQRVNAGEISVAAVGHIAAQTTEAHRPIADPLEAPTEIGPLLEVLHVVTAPPRVTEPAAAIATLAPIGEQARRPPRAAHRVAMARPVVTVSRVVMARRVVTADRGATARPDARATAVVAAPRVGARAMAEATRAIARSAPLGVNATAETRDPSRPAWTSPMFRRT